MKKVLMFAAVLFAFSANAQDNANLKPAVKPATDSRATGTPYGKKFDEKTAISVPELVKKAQGRELAEVVVSGTISEVCQTEGCWIRVSMENDEGSTMLVKFKDHEFTIPKDLAGKKVVFSGRAYQAKISVEMLKHYAEDAGKSKEEIEKITAPSTELAVEATGLIIK